MRLLLPVALGALLILTSSAPTSLDITHGDGLVATLSYDADTDDVWTAVVEFCDRTFGDQVLAAFHHTCQCIEQVLDLPQHAALLLRPPPPPPLFWSFPLNPNAALATAAFSPRHPPFRLFVHDPDTCHGVSRLIAARGYYDAVKTVRQFRVLAALGPTAVLLDVGAHVGWFSLLAAAAGHDAIAVEPMHYNLELLNASLAVNDPAVAARVTLLPFAAGDTETDGHPPLCLRPVMNGGGHNSGNAALVLQGDDGGDCAGAQRDVPLRRLDAIVSPERWARIEVVKFDCEGSEGRAWAGLAGLLARHRPCLVFVEVFYGFASHDALADAMQHHGYRLFPQVTVASDADWEVPLARVLARGGGGELPQNDYELRHTHERCRVVF